MARMKKEGEKEMSREEDKHQARKGESPCNFSNPPGIYTFTRQIMKMKSKMENFPSQTGHRIFFFKSVALLNFFFPFSQCLSGCVLSQHNSQCVIISCHGRCDSLRPLFFNCKKKKEE